MKIKTFLTVIAFSIIIVTFSQKPTFDLSFTAIESATYKQLDSIKVMNRTQGGDTVLFWPDTILVLDYQNAIYEFNKNDESLKLFQNYPNPVRNSTTISLYISQKDKVNIIIFDKIGRLIIQTGIMLERGFHSFLFEPGNGNLFLFTAKWRGKSKSIKILHATSNSRGIGSLEYLGEECINSQLKATKAVQNFSYNLGDTLLYIGYTDTLQSGLLDKPESSQTYAIQFASNIPCPGTPTVSYDGQVYNTVQIFSQCWLKENLNVGTMIQGEENMEDNGIIEKYCKKNVEDSCTIYGGLYQWDEMMQYAIKQGVQGICPTGWHIPTSGEWKILEGVADSQFRIGDPEWDDGGNRGFDVGLNLKSTIHWYYYNGLDLYGFSAIPGDWRGANGIVGGGDFSAYFWISDEDDNYYARFRELKWGFNSVYSSDNYKGLGYSVRCLMD